MQDGNQNTQHCCKECKQVLERFAIEAVCDWKNSYPESTLKCVCAAQSVLHFYFIALGQQFHGT